MLGVQNASGRGSNSIWISLISSNRGQNKGSLQTPSPFPAICKSSTSVPCFIYEICIMKYLWMNEKQLDLCQLEYLNSERNDRFQFFLLAIQIHCPHFTFSVSQNTLAFLQELQLNRMDTNEHFAPCWLALLEIMQPSGHLKWWW